MEKEALGLKNNPDVKNVYPNDQYTMSFWHYEEPEQVLSHLIYCVMFVENRFSGKVSHVEMYPNPISKEKEDKIVSVFKNDPLSFNNLGNVNKA